MAQATTSATADVCKTLAAIGDALGAVMDMAREEPDFEPLQDYMARQIIEGGIADFDMTDLVLDADVELDV